MFYLLAPIGLFCFVLFFFNVILTIIIFLNISLNHQMGRESDMNYGTLHPSELNHFKKILCGLMATL